MEKCLEAQDNGPRDEGVVRVESRGSVWLVVMSAQRLLLVGSQATEKWGFARTLRKGRKGIRERWVPTG
jgi:hypothetical protein